MQMDMGQVRQRVEQIEQCADEVVAAMRHNATTAPKDLQQCVNDMHQQARQARDLVRQQQADEGQIVSSVDRLEATGDRAMQACRSAGTSVTPQLQSAVQKAHDQISEFKKQLH